MPPKLMKKKSKSKSKLSLDLVPKASPITVPQVEEPVELIKRISNSIKSDLCDYYNKCDCDIEDTDLIIDLTLQAMNKFETEDLSNNNNDLTLKKEIINSSVEDCINCKINDEKHRKFLLDLQKELTPAIIDIGVSASRSAIKVKLKLTTSNNCFAMCCGCCYNPLKK